MINCPAACHPKQQPPLMSTYDSWGQIVQWHRFTNSDYGPNGSGVFGGFFPALRKKANGIWKEEVHFSTERCAIKKYVHIATTSNMLLAVSTPVCPCREAKNHSTCSPEANGYKLEQNPIAIGYSGIWFRTWDGKTPAPPGMYKTS